MAVSAIHKIKHEERGRDANKARGEAECFIGHQGSAKCFILCIARARPCFNCFKGFTY